MKSSNILTDTNGTIKLNNYGYSQYLDMLLQCLDPQEKNDYLWRAPEINLQEGFDTRSDIWAVGCLAIELITARPPCYRQPQETLVDVLKLHGKRVLPKIPSGISPQCNKFISDCLKYDIKSRKTIQDLLTHPFITGSGNIYFI